MPGNRGRPGSNPPLLPFRSLGISLSCINAYLAIDSGGNVSEYSSRVITARLECLVDISCAVTIAAGAERHATPTIPAINYFLIYTYIHPLQEAS